MHININKKCWKTSKCVFSALASKLNMVLINKDRYGMFFTCVCSNDGLMLERQLYTNFTGQIHAILTLVDQKTY